VRYSIGLYTVFAFSVLAEHEMYSLWAATGKEYGEIPHPLNSYHYLTIIRRDEVEVFIHDNHQA
jgi:hypothetical protein